MAESDVSNTPVIPSPQDYVLEAIFMLFAVLPVVVSAYASYWTGDGHWFQRSGALMVLFSVAVEFHRTRVFGDFNRHGDSDADAPSETHYAVVRFWRSIPYICYSAIFMGTIIWSYGDLLFD